MLPKSLDLFASFLLFALGEAAFMPDFECVNKEIGWLRLHTVPATWADARLSCNIEGGNLASPTTDAIITLIKTSMSNNGLTQSSVFVDMHATNPKGNFTSIEGKLLTSISLVWAAGEPNNLGDDEDCLAMNEIGELMDVNCGSVRPYICMENTVETYKKCDTEKGKRGASMVRRVRDSPNTILRMIAGRVDCSYLGYRLDPESGNCYKFHLDAVSWRQAYMTCASEHAHLAVINSDKESEVLMDIFEKYPAETITGATYNQWAHIGFLDWNKKHEFLTVFGETLKEAGFEKWEKDQSENNKEEQYCGSMSREGLLNDIQCVTANLPFFCETS